MPAFPQCLPEIQTGDVLLFKRSPSLFGRLIRWRTQSRYSHVGIALWTSTEGFKRLCVLEALEHYGVREHPLDRYLAECLASGCVIDWYVIDDPKIDRRKVAYYAWLQVGKQYASPWQFLRAFGWLSRRLLRWCGVPVDTDPERFFCSELVAEAFRYGGYVQETPDELAPAETDPGSIAEFTCLQRRGTIYLSGPEGSTQ